MYLHSDFSLPLEILFPVFDSPLLTAFHRKRVCWHGLCYRRPRGGRRVFAHLYGSYQICIAPDKRVVADLGAEMVYPVIVGGNAAAAEIDPAPNVAVPYISKMTCGGILTDNAVLYLHKIPDLHAAPGLSFGAA